MSRRSRPNFTSHDDQIAELKLLRNHVSACVESDVVEEDVLGQIDQMINAHYLGMHNHRICYIENERIYRTIIDLPEGSKKRYKQISSNSMEKLKKKLINYYKTHEHKVTVQGVFRMWMEERIRYNEIELSSRDRFETDFKRVFVASGFSVRYIDEITEDDLDQWIREMICDYHLSRKAWANIRGILSGIFKFAKRKKMTAISISHFLSDLQLSDHMFRHIVKGDWEEVFSDEELEKIVGWITDVQYPERQRSLSNLGILLCIFTGLRAGEIVALKKTDLKDSMLRVTRTQTRYKSDNGGYVYDIRDSTKGRDGWREIAIPDVAVKIINRISEINPQEEFLFVNPTTGQKMLSSSFSGKLKRICEYLEIPLKSLHKIRKTYASILLDAGVSDKIVTSQMGHTDITTTRGFYYKNRHSAQEKIAAVTNALTYPALLVSNEAAVTEENHPL